MKLPAAIGGLLVTAIAGGVAIAGEVAISHPLHQAIIVAAALVTGLIGYLTLASPSGPPAPAPESAAAIAALNAQAQANVLKLARAPDGVDSADVAFSHADVDAAAAAHTGLAP